MKSLRKEIKELGLLAKIVSLEAHGQEPII